MRNVKNKKRETGKRIRVGRQKRSTLEGQVREVEGNELITTLHSLVFHFACESLASAQVVKDMEWNKWRVLHQSLFTYASGNC